MRSATAAIAARSCAPPFRPHRPARCFRTVRTGAIVDGMTDVDQPAYNRRSWLLPTDTAEALAKAIEDLHFETRLPKWQVGGVVVTHGLANLDAVRAALAELL